MDPITLASAASVVAANLHALGVTDVLSIEAREAYPHESPAGSDVRLAVWVHTSDATVTDLIGERCNLPICTYPDFESNMNYTREGAVHLSNGSTVVLHVFGPTPQPRDVTTPSVAPAVTR